ncbi:sensor domain-containing diguanylate cyclase [Metabacillus malikii]|uniref:Diguanylate cyclase (GGDEF)-like protein/PAS domain S-box-containing protein n=1 Tax=Metabacillus malikii TaxID=1504265 RepID=A0ABT9ZHT8_9BACI|nr:diguanylate cyclase [Metabacillus malikii]MDQ0231853.1 diguanylate cyclase (GGDEF)-like protein/PAS domain S-box-containing protein [Metabacillus malikii]
MKLLFYCMLYLVPACIFVYMAGMVLSRNRTSAKHITCSLLFVFTSMWFFGVFISVLIYPKFFNEISLYWVNGSITISGILSLHLWFMNANLYSKKNGKYLTLLFIPGIAMLLTLPIDSWMLKEGTAEMSYIPGPGLYLLWLVDFSYIAIIFFIMTIEVKKKNQAAKLWFKGILFYFLWTIITLTAAILLQNTVMYFFYFLIPHGTFFWAFAIFRSMSRYDYLSSYETRYHILFERSPLGILIMDEEGIVLEASPQIAMYLGVNKQELINESIVSFLGGIDKQAFYMEFNKIFTEKTKVENFELSFINKNKERKTLLIDSDYIIVEGKTLQFVMIKDITEAKTKEERVRYLAYHDLLTGLSNRAAFEKRINELLMEEETFYLLLLDLNKLKQINDTYGHQAGDHAIQKIAMILQEVAGNSHHAARLGGDEFVMLVSGEEVESILSNFQKKLETPFVLPHQQKIQLSASVGVSC